MYIYNTDTGMWVKQTDTLNKDDYNNLKQDLAKMQLYSRALSGATYIYTSNTASIYESISYKDNNSWYIDPISSPYNSMSLPSSGAPIDSSNFDKYKDYTYEYGFTLKNLFTPTKAIDILNTINVSVATTGAVDLTSTTFSSIDGIELKEGNLVLVKDQLSTVDLAYTVDPNLYFLGNYYLVNDNVADITYQYYGETNGIYEFIDGSLVKITMATYSLTSQLSVYVNLGKTYQDKQFALSRLLDGYYPVEGQPFEFKESHNYLVRNQVDYHNLYETNYYDVLKHATQSLIIEGYTYTIPERLLYIGDFGVILNKQDTTYSQYVFNNCKENLKCITQTTAYYWICGDNGTILKMSKLDFSITKIDLGEEFHNLTSISFLDDMNGIVVGKYNTIYRTFDGGYTWRKVLIGKDNYSYNRVFYYNYNLIYIAGESGIFCELAFSDTSGYTPNFISLVKNLSLTDTYDLIEDINDMYYTHFDTWGLTYAVPVDLMAGNGINYSMECLFLVTNNNIMCYEINDFVTQHAVLYLAFSQSIGNLNSITRVKGTDIMYVAGDNIISFDINTFEYTSVTSNQILGTTNSLISNSQYTNRLFDYNGEYIYNVGNFASIYERNYLTPTIYTAISTETITPKMLFMEYDMADKLNFFDSDYNYRLPISITFGSTQSSTALSALKFNSIQDTCLDYLIDSYKTYGINSDTSTGNTILLSTQFEYGNYSYTYSNTDISISYSDMSGLYPFVNSKTASRYTQFTPIIPSSSYSVFMYGYMSIFKLPSTFCKVGDLLEISSNSITTNVMVNYGLTTSTSVTYFYAFNDLNQSILNTIKSSATLTIKNLNKFNSASVIQSNFDSHPISDAYKLSYDGITYTLSPRFNNITAYKSLETNVEVYYSSITNNYNVSYPTTFNQFGYTPNYSLLNYLSTINSGFTASKKFYTMPEYTSLPCNGAGTFTENNIYYDSNQPIAGTVSFPKNKLIFGNNLKYEYDTLWVNTFVDLTLTTNSGTFTKTQVLITDKYYDSTFNGWALIFNDSIIKTDDGVTHYGVTLNNINIISRNTLGEISADLEIFNNLNKPLVSKKYNSGLYYMNIYDNPIKTKINTDSYTKILLSDGDIKKYITSIIYTNDKNILTMNVVNISKTEDIAINNTFIVGSNLALSTGNLQNINGSLSAYLTFNGGTGSSQELNPNYNGIHTINKLDDYDLTVNTPYLNYPSVIDTGILKVNIFDPFFNYQVVNLLDITDNNKYKIPTILTPYNFYSIGLTNSLINLNNSKPAFRLVDGLDIDTLSTNYHWILEAEISDAIIGLDSNGIVWYNGIWHSGRWFGGTWYSGTWISGDWYSGTWNSVQITDKVTSVSVGQSSYDNQKSMWYNGRWFDGYWQAGTWLDGRWYNGTWNDGLWFNGIWNDGKWNTGSFYGGIWVQGYWLSGIFNAFNKPAYWIDGSFDSGDFQNGIWYNGTFGINYNTLNKFGASASNSRNAVWHGGVWASGNFYSYENINGSTVSVSSTHKFSNWRTGVWNKGNFYGGIIYNIEFQAGTWYGGIVDDIEVIGLNPMTNQITLNGEFRFNIGDYINIITDGTSTPYNNVGNYNQPGRYKVALTEFDYTNNWTILTLNYDFSTFGLTGYYSATASSNVDTGLRLVSKYSNIDWYSGIWNNGIFDGGNFYGGIWYDGVFSGNWGV
jgi:hypothetical protein